MNGKIAKVGVYSLYFCSQNQSCFIAPKSYKDVPTSMTHTQDFKAKETIKKLTKPTGNKVACGDVVSTYNGNRVLVISISK